jgi:uncharacterized membrane protein YfhO
MSFISNVMFQYTETIDMLLNFFTQLSSIFYSFFSPIHVHMDKARSSISLIKKKLLKFIPIFMQVCMCFHVDQHLKEKKEN